MEDQLLDQHRELQRERQEGAEWLEKMFEFEVCPECRRDANAHTVLRMPKTHKLFARCELTPLEECDACHDFTHPDNIVKVKDVYCNSHHVCTWCADVGEREFERILDDEKEKKR